MTEARIAPAVRAPLLSVAGLSVDYHTPDGDVPGARSVSFDVREGETVAIVGESGSGKSTVGRALLGLIDARSASVHGSVSFRGDELLATSDLPEPSRRAREVATNRLRGNLLALIPQKLRTPANPVQRIGTQLVEQILAHQRGRGDVRETAVELLRHVGLEACFDSFPHQLSGGMIQRFWIAMALANEPKCIVADEATTALDVVRQREFLQALATWKASHSLGVVLITHDLAIVHEVADRVLVMRGGKIVESGVTRELFRDPRDPYTRSLLRAVPRMHDGRASRRDRPARIDGDVVLRVDGLEKNYVTSSWFGLRRSTTTHVLRDVRLSIRAGETVALVGKSGCGKSTLARCIAGICAPTSGTIDVRGTTPGMVFQDAASSMNPLARIVDSVSAPIRWRGVPRREALRVAERLLDEVGLGGLGKRYPTELSGGQIQRAAIARALTIEPKLLVLDEAVTALDASLRADILAQLDELQDSRGVSYLFITHDLCTAIVFADRLLVMRDGRLEEGVDGEGYRELLGALPGYQRGDADRSTEIALRSPA